MAKVTVMLSTTYNILQAMGEDVEFLYDTIDKYIEDIRNANNH